MAKRKHTPEEIINKLREAEVVIAAGSTVAETSRRIGISEQTFYRWRAKYRGLRIDQARHLKQLETENGCLPARHVRGLHRRRRTGTRTDGGQGRKTAPQPAKTALPAESADHRRTGLRAPVLHRRTSCSQQSGSHWASPSPAVSWLKASRISPMACSIIPRNACSRFMALSSSAPMRRHPSILPVPTPSHLVNSFPFPTTFSHTQRDLLFDKRLIRGRIFRIPFTG